MLLFFVFLACGSINIVTGAGMTSFARKSSPLTTTGRQMVILPPELAQLEEKAAISLMSMYETSVVEFDGTRVPTAFVKFAKTGAEIKENVPTPTVFSALSSLFEAKKEGVKKSKSPPLVLLHGFDSSALEYRRLAPLLAENRDVFVPDILGWGFSNHDAVQSFTPAAKMAHLKSFVRNVVKQPCVIVGASLGGALAITLAVESPELVSQVVLIDAQGFIDGEGPKDIPDSVAIFGVNVLKSVPLRMFANLIAYKDKSCATWDAMRCGRLHCYTESWERASVSFLKSGGFVVSDKVPLVQQNCLVLWGRNDEILEPSTAAKFEQLLPNGRVSWIEECGHVPHLEKPQQSCQEIIKFLNENP